MKAGCAIFFAASMAAALCASAHTTAESNMVVRAALYGALTFYPDNIEDGLALPPGVEEPNTWRGFLGGDTNGWTLAEKKASFDWYLTTLGTNDCKSLDEVQREEIGMAIDMCDELNHTNSLPAIKALALNPNGVYRQDAIEFIIKFSPVDDSTTAFVETIMTNSTSYNFREQGKASAHYASRLLSFNATNAVQIASRAAGVRMLYRNRLLESGTDAIIDEVFLKYIDGYGSSSNRLEYAINSFSYPKCAEIFGDYFTSVTNQLLSSGQPLPWIDVGGDGN